MAKSLDSQFADWVSQQPAERTYRYGDICGCAYFEFLDAAGYPVLRVGGYDWRDTNHDLHDINKRVAHALGLAPHTYGALAERLAA